MQNCSNNPISNNQGCYPIQGPNAVSINIISPQAYGTAPCSQSQQIPNYYPMYGVNPNPGFIYPSNYNNFFPSNSLNAFNNEKLPKKAVEEPIEEKKEEDKKTEEEKTKKITPLTNEYVQSLENYLNNDNPKIRLIGAKELMERFKEDDNRKDNPSLIPLLNKVLKDTSAAVRFLGLTTLQLGYCVGDNETVEILKAIQAQNQDKFGEDSLLASQILLNLSAPEQVEVLKDGDK